MITVISIIYQASFCELINIHALTLHGELIIASPCNEGVEKCIYLLLNNDWIKFEDLC